MQESGMDAGATGGDVIRNRIYLLMEGQKCSLITFMGILVCFGL